MVFWVSVVNNSPIQLIHFGSYLLSPAAEVHEDVVVSVTITLLPNPVTMRASLRPNSAGETFLQKVGLKAITQYALQV